MNKPHFICHVSYVPHQKKDLTFFLDNGGEASW